MRACDNCGKGPTKPYRVAAYPGYRIYHYCAACAKGHEHNEVKR